LAQRLGANGEAIDADGSQRGCSLAVEGGWVALYGDLEVCGAHQELFEAREDTAKLARLP
jgi:hypothetical protein